jgi:CoA-transferase family III/Binding-protein-dependent transport system inner membrane component
MLSRESQDLIIQARTGLMSATGIEEGHARPVGSAIIDQHAGALLAMGITAAYVRKLTTGEGTRVEGSLFAAGFDVQTEPLTVYMSTRPGRQILNRDPHIASWYHNAPYGVYQCKDREMAVSTNPLPKLAEALNSDELRAIQTSHPYKDRDKVTPVFNRTVYPIIVFSQLIPKIAIAPLFVIWFGFLPKLLIAFLISFFPIVIQAIVGFTSIRPEPIRVALSMGAGPITLFFKVLLPHALPIFRARARSPS